LNAAGWLEWRQATDASGTFERTAVNIADFDWRSKTKN
jgi:hypothetical protein